MLSDIRKKITKLTDEDVKFLQEMNAGEHKAFMETVINDAVCEKFNEISKAKGNLAAEKFLDDKLLEGINQYRSELALEPERERVREKVQEDMSHKGQAENASIQNRSESPDDELLKLTMRKIVEAKISGKELSYGESLKLTQEENPLLAAAILGRMNEFRRKPPRPWER